MDPVQLVDQDPPLKDAASGPSSSSLSPEGMLLLVSRNESLELTSDLAEIAEGPPSHSILPLPRSGTSPVATPPASQAKRRPSPTHTTTPSSSQLGPRSLPHTPATPVVSELPSRAESMPQSTLATHPPIRAMPRSILESRARMPQSTACIPSKPSVHSSPPSSQEVKTNLQNLLVKHIALASKAIIVYVEEHGCADLLLKLKVLDLRTRREELDRLEASTLAVTGQIVQVVRQAEEDVVTYLDGREESVDVDFDLRIKILDLKTRLQEWRKTLTSE